MHQLVNARGAQPYCLGDLSDRQARVMRSGHIGDSLVLGRREPVGTDAQPVAYLLFAPQPLARLFRSVHAAQDA